MRYQIRHAWFQYDDGTTILNDINFEIRNNEKIALVGRNGCGKTTLLKIMSGELKISNIDSDEEAGIFMSGRQEIGYLKQISFVDGSVTVADEIKKAFAPVFACEKRMAEIEAALSNDEVEIHADQNDAIGETDPGDHSLLDSVSGEDRSRRLDTVSIEDKHRRLLGEYNDLQKKMEALRGYTWEQDMNILFQKFGFPLEDLSRPIGTFSGGQQTKVAFIKLLLERPDIMLLDEPTNHLDLPTIEWLESYLKSYEKAVVIVSHDRMFLDRITDVTYEIEYHEIKRYPGNYSAFMRQKEENLIKQEKDYEEQQKEIARLTEWIEKWKNTPSKVTATHSKRMMIEHMVKIEKPRRFDTRTFKAYFTPDQESWNDVLSVTHLSIGYDHVLSEISFLLEKGDRMAVIGENGKGKSTLLKTVIGMIPALGGMYRIGTNVQIGYFDQQKAVTTQYDPEQTILDNFWDEYPHLMREDVRSALGAFMFSQDEVEKKMGILSGGEKVRLELCKMFYTKPNLLILDEPTNHMDIMGKEALEKMLQTFPGTVLFVSHDRYFIKQIATAILDFEKDCVREYHMDYTAYLEEKDKREKGLITDLYSGKDSGNGKAGNHVKTTGSNSQNLGNGGNSSKKDAVPTLDDVFDKKSYYNPGKIISRLQKQLEKYEAKLLESEETARELELQLSDPALSSDYEKLMELQNLLDAEHHQQDSLLERILETELELQEMDQKTNT